MAETSLFGATPESIQRERDAAMQQEALQYAKLDPFQRATADIYAGFGRIGNTIGGLLGGVDPEIQRATQRQELSKGLRVDDPSSYMQAAQKAAQMGDYGAARELIAQGQSLQMKRAQLGSEQALAAQRLREKEGADPYQQLLRTGKYTPASLADYKETGDPAVLDTIEKSLSRPEIQQLQVYRNTLPVGSRERAEVDKVIEAAGKGRGTTITNQLPGVKGAGDVTGLRKDLQAITKPYQDQSDAAQDAISLANMALKDNNFAAVSSLSRSLAKAAGETQLSRNDVEAFGIDPSLVGRVSDTVSTLAKSRPTVDTLTKLRQLAEALKKKADSRIDIEEQQLQETARVSGLYTEPQITTVFRRRPATSKTEFTSVKDAEAANLPAGTRITINGRQAIVEK